MSFLFVIFRKVFGFGFAALFALSGALSSAPSVVRGDIVPENEFQYPYSDGAAFCQGITSDGTYLYGTGCIKFLNYNALVRIDAETGEILQFNDMCLPADIIAKGYSHLGDCSYYDGRIYVACEAFMFKDPAVMVFDAGTLEFLECHVLPPEGQGNGHIPWVCVRNGIVYYTQAREVDELRMLNADDFSYSGCLKLDKTITKITGGDISGDTLFLSSDEGSEEKTTYSVDLKTGETKEAFVRNMGNTFTEAEGLSITETETGTQFRYVDVFFASKTVIRTYRFTGSQP